VSVFRPAAKVTSPDGRAWEIYAYRFRWQPPRRRRDLLRALVASLRSDWTIDAVTFEPHQTVHTWTTTAEHKGQVLAQVEGHLARGDVPLRLSNAVYRRSAR
jgi:hypothetical protein